MFTKKWYFVHARKFHFWRIGSDTSVWTVHHHEETEFPLLAWHLDVVAEGEKIACCSKKKKGGKYNRYYEKKKKASAWWEMAGLTTGQREKEKECTVVWAKRSSFIMFQCWKPAAFTCVAIWVKCKHRSCITVPTEHFQYWRLLKLLMRGSTLIL